MKVSILTKEALAFRRFDRAMRAKGYWHLPDPVWEINRGYLIGERITDVKIDPAGKTIYVKVSNAPFNRNDSTRMNETDTISNDSLGAAPPPVDNHNIIQWM